MNYRETLSKFDMRKQNPVKTFIPEADSKSFLQLSPRLSNLERPAKFENSRQAEKSPEFQKKTQTRPQSIAKKGKSDLETENKALKEKIETLQRERDIIRNWKKGKNDSQVYKEKLSFLVRNIQQFLQNSLKFQNMLRDKMGGNIASLYEEESNLLKSQLLTAAQDSDIPIMYSPITSPLRNAKSPRIEEISSIDSDNRLLEELRLEKLKNKKLQNELNSEISKKDEEIRKIRDRIIDLEKNEKAKLDAERNLGRASQDWAAERKELQREIEKSKVEAEKSLGRVSQDWAAERKDLQRELEKGKNETRRMKEKLNEFDEVYLEMKQDNSNIKTKCEELIQENFKLSESLQTYDRLYNYSKKWAEKAVSEVRENWEGKVLEITSRLEESENRLEETMRNLSAIIGDKRERDEESGFRLKELEEEKQVLKSKLIQEMSEKNRILEKGQNESRELCVKIAELEEKLKKNTDSSKNYSETCEKLSKDCGRYSSELQSLQKELKTLQANLLTCKNEKQVLQLELDKKSSEVSEQKIEYQEEENRLNEIVQSQSLKILELETIIEESSKDLLNLEIVFKEKESLAEKLGKNQEKIRDLESEKRSISEVLQKKEEEIRVLGKDKDSIKSLLQNKESELRGKVTECEDLLKIISELEVKSAEAKELVQLRQQLNNLNEKILKQEDQNKLSHLQNLDLIEKLTKKDSESIDLQNSLEEAQGLLKIKEKSIENLKFSLNDQQTLLSTLNTKESYIQKIEIKVKDLTEQLKHKDKQTEDLRAFIESQKNLLQTQETQLKSLDDLPKLYQEKLSLKELLETSQKHSATLEKLLKEKEDCLKIKDAKLKDLDSSLVVNKQLTEKLAFLTNENQNISERLNQLKDLPSQLSQKDSEISSLKKSLELCQASRDSILSEKEALKSQSSSCSDQLEALNLKIESLKSEKEKNLFSISEQKDQLTKLAQNLTHYQSQCEMLKSESASKDTEVYKTKLKFQELEALLKNSDDKLKALTAESEESRIADKEEILRLSNALLKTENHLSHYKKENSSLAQSINSLESLKKHCDNCESLKLKVSEFECLIHSAEESLGGFFNNTLIESIQSLISNRTQTLRKAPRPPLLRASGQKRQSEELKSSQLEEIPKSPAITEGSKRSHSSVPSFPEISDLQNELIEEKSENERYLTQIKILKEDIRELERKLKRSQEVNEKVNTELLASSLVKLVRNLPYQSSEVESMISLILSIVSVPKEQLMKLEGERKSKNSKKFGVF